MSGPALLAGGARCAPPSGLDPSAGFALPHTPTGGYGIRPYGARVDAPHRPGKLLPVSVGSGNARRRGRGCCAESARSGQDRSLHGTRERRIVGRGLDPSAGFALPHTPTGGYGIRPYGAGVDSPHRPGKLLPVSAGAGHALYRFASFPATSPDRPLMTSTSTSRTTAVP